MQSFFSSKKSWEIIVRSYLSRFLLQQLSADPVELPLGVGEDKWGGGAAAVLVEVVDPLVRQSGHVALTLLKLSLRESEKGKGRGEKVMLPDN